MCPPPERRYLPANKKIFYSPKQAAVAVEWVSKQNWADDRISLLGFSIGSIVAPSVQRLLENRKNVKVNFLYLHTVEQI